MGLSDIYIAMVYAAFFVVGLTTPFVLSLGYLWGWIPPTRSKSARSSRAVVSSGSFSRPWFGT